MQRTRFLKACLTIGTAFASPFAGAVQTLRTDRVDKGFEVASGQDRFNHSVSLFDGHTFMTKVSTKDTNGDLYVYESRRVKEGSPAPHVHFEQDELWYVLEGEFLIKVGSFAKTYIVCFSKTTVTGKQVIKRYSVLICLVSSVLFVVIATFVYPGGTLFNKNSTGFDWSKNFFTSLFAAKAINGLANPSRIWALIGLAFHSVGYGLFFVNMSKKIPQRHSRTALKLIGAVIIPLTCLIATPWHDVMVSLSNNLFLIGLIYITVSVVKTTLHWLKFFCISCLLTFYYTLYLYASHDWGLLAIMQKVSFISSMVLVLGLEYLTRQGDFKPTKQDGQTNP